LLFDHSQVVLLLITVDLGAAFHVQGAKSPAPVAKWNSVCYVIGRVARVRSQSTEKENLASDEDETEWHHI
jgi:hypothetical protein